MSTSEYYPQLEGARGVTAGVVRVRCIFGVLSVAMPLFAFSLKRALRLKAASAVVGFWLGGHNKWGHDFFGDGRPALFPMLSDAKRTIGIRRQCRVTVPHWPLAALPLTRSIGRNPTPGSRGPGHVD
jgi:hypothetical protein